MEAMAGPRTGNTSDYSAEIPLKQIDVNIYRTFIPLLAGGVGAAVGQAVTCPLDVIQTRLQSTQLSFSTSYAVGNNSNGILLSKQTTSCSRYFQTLTTYLRHMVKTEGFKSMFKGMSPGLFGIVPAKAIYFWCYAHTKNYLSHVSRHKNYTVHSLSALLAGSVTATMTNPIWYIKTQLQLDKDSKSIYQVLKEGYRIHGSKCFFRGLSASYAGVSEAVIYFILYEDLKERMELNKQFLPGHYVMAALISKVTATSLTYPHEVVRTRLRQDEKDTKGRLKYRNFFQTLKTVAKEEGVVGLYGGFGTGLVRQLPNTAAVFLTYEAILHMVEWE